MVSLHIMNDNNNSCIICIDEKQTKQFQNIFMDKNIFAHTEYQSFGYTKWKHYLLFFGGEIRSERIHKSIDSIFYFDVLQMKWHKSLKVKPFHTNTCCYKFVLLAPILYFCHLYRRVSNNIIDFFTTCIVYICECDE